MKRVTTIRDIAERLEISTSTVSRILNGKNVRNKRLVNDVLKAARQMNYQVNTAAKGLRTNKTKLLGIIVPELGDDFFAAILSGMEASAEKAGYNLLVCQSNESHKKEKQLIKSLIACNVEGVLISPSKETLTLHFLDQLTAMGKKAVLFDRTFEQSKHPTISFSDFDGAYLAGQHLVRTNHQRFLYFGFSENLKNDHERQAGYNAVLKENGLPACKVIYVNQNNFTAEELDTHWSEEYDAVVCYNDLIAAQVIAGFNLLGVSVPDQVSVFGFDNRPICNYTSPALSSVEHSTHRMGVMAVDTLLDLINEKEIHVSDIDAELVIRKSTSDMRKSTTKESINQ